MNKRILYVAMIVVMVAAFYFLFIKQDAGAEKGPKESPVYVGKNTLAFDISYNKILDAYFEMKDALVADDTTKTNAAALLLSFAADSLKIDEIQDDSTGAIKTTARDFASTLSASAKGLQGDATIAEKRKEFELITDALWNLTRTVQFSGRKIYYQFCPMAFDDKGAFWMSADSEINNPYFGAAMLHCGSLEDSLDYSKH